MAGILVADIRSRRRSACGIAQVGVLAGGGNARSGQDLAFTGKEQRYDADYTRHIIGHGDIG